MCRQTRTACRRAAARMSVGRRDLEKEGMHMDAVTVGILLFDGVDVLVVPGC